MAHRVCDAPALSVRPRSSFVLMRFQDFVASHSSPLPQQQAIGPGSGVGGEENEVSASVRSSIVEVARLSVLIRASRDLKCNIRSGLGEREPVRKDSASESSILDWSAWRARVAENDETGGRDTHRHQMRTLDLITSRPLTTCKFLCPSHHLFHSRI